MIRLAPHEIRARRRPGAIAMYWAARLAPALLVALPVSSAFQALGVARVPIAGDAGLFAPGGLLLAEAFRLGAPAWASLFGTSALVLAVFSFLMLVPLAGLYVALAHGGRLELPSWVAVALQHWPRFILLSGATLLGQAAIVILFILVHSLLERLFSARLDQRWSFILSAAWYGLGALGLLVLDLVQDLARAARVQRAGALADDLAAALGALRRQSLRLVGGWLLALLGSLAAVAIAAYTVEQLHVEHGGSLRLALVTFVHQLAALTLAVLRASWIALALRGVAESFQQRH